MRKSVENAFQIIPKKPRITLHSCKRKIHCFPLLNCCTQYLSLNLRLEYKRWIIMFKDFVSLKYKLKNHEQILKTIKNHV